MPKIKEVVVRPSYRLDLVFDDGIRGTVDLSHLVSKGVFALWQDYSAFERVRIGPSGELIWSDQIDLCPDALYLKATGKSPEAIFTKLGHELAHA